ncbi:MAG: DNA recombination protein RmuC, partial [Firmicutes bacterium]|nr:DNA recombination protein RmuC [Bacillota bacterium]
QREYHIIVTGPTTVTALLNSLQMGFRTLAIQKRSSEVWKLLGAVKTEFGKFGEVLEKTQKKLQEASHSIDSAAVRSRAIERKLRSVESVSAAESERWLNEANDEEKK